MQKRVQLRSDPLRAPLFTLDKLMPPLLLLLLAAGVLWPLLHIALGALNSGSIGQPGSTYSLESLKWVFTDPGSLSGMRNTLRLSSLTTALSLTMGSSLAWFIARTDIPFRRALQIMVVFPLFLSPFAGAIAWMQMGSAKVGYLNIALRALFGPNAGLVDIFTFTGLAWVMSLYFVPLAYLLVVSALSGMDASLEEASHIAGGGTFTTLRRITAPIMLPAIIAAAIMVFVLSAEMFSIPGLLGGPSGINTMSYQIYLSVSYSPAKWQNAAAISLVLLSFMAVGIYVYQRLTRLSYRFVTVGGRGTRSNLVRLGPLRWLAMFVCILYFSLAVVLPYAAIALGSVVRYASPDVFKELAHFSTSRLFTGDVWLLTLRSVAFRESLWRTIWVSLFASVLTTMLALAISFVLVKTRSRLRTAIDFLTSLPIAIPSIVFGVGLIWAFIRSPIYGTIWILILGYVVHHIPISLRMINANLIQLSSELEEAARVGGAAPWRAAWDILLPLARPAILSSWILLFIQVVRELSMSIMLVGSRTTTLSVLLWDHMEGGNYASANVISLVLSGIILVVFLIASKLFKVEMVRKL